MNNKKRLDLVCLAIFIILLVLSYITHAVYSAMISSFGIIFTSAMLCIDWGDDDE